MAVVAGGRTTGCWGEGAATEGGSGVRAGGAKARCRDRGGVTGQGLAQIPPCRGGSCRVVASAVVEELGAVWGQVQRVGAVVVLVVLVLGAW